MIFRSHGKRWYESEKHGVVLLYDKSEYKELKKHLNTFKITIYRDRDAYPKGDLEILVRKTIEKGCVIELLPVEPTLERAIYSVGVPSDKLYEEARKKYDVSATPHEVHISKRVESTRDEFVLGNSLSVWYSYQDFLIGREYELRPLDRKNTIRERPAIMNERPTRSA